jgi:hypothetical protein
MISRLLLVGMVGVLGISLPDGADLGMKLTWARTGATACACRRETVTFEPIAVGDDAPDRIADELNRQSEGIDLPMVTMVRVAAAERPGRVATDDVVARMFAENQVWAEQSAAEAAVPKGHPAAKMTEDVVAKLFAENQVWAEPMVEAGRAKAQPTKATDDVVARMFAENQVWAEPAVAAIASPAPKARPSFEPIAVVEAESNIADELNHASEGLNLAREPEPTVGTALRLTRDAALAWMNVLAKTTATESHSR